jgi:hypothetical protein
MAIAGWRRAEEIDARAANHDRKAGWDWGRRGLPASAWMSGKRPDAFEQACREGQAAWLQHHDCPECHYPIGSQRAALLHWRERHAPGLRAQARYEPIE